MGSAEKTASVAVVLGVRQPGATASEARADDTLQVLTHAYDGKGQRVASEQVTATIALRPRATGEIVYEVLSRLELKPGRYHLRVAAESARSGSAGSVYCDIDVPDFGRLPLSLSGVVLGVTPGPPSGAKEKLASLLPVVPTAEREFGRGDRVSAFIRVYQGGRSGVGPVSLRVQAHDQRNALVFEHAATLAANRFAGRSADVLVQLPLSSFTPGPHLLTIEAEQGRRKARRDVRLAVRD